MASTTASRAARSKSVPHLKVAVACACGCATPAWAWTRAATAATGLNNLRARLAAQLAVAWPELEVVAQARNGREAVGLFDEHTPDIVFLDVHMPGMNGVDAARAIDRRALVVFVTAFEQYAVQAFEEGALDDRVKPFEPARLASTVARLKLQRHAQLSSQTPSEPAPGLAPALLDQLADALQRHAAPLGSPRNWLQRIKASSGNTVRLIPVDEKYTLVVWAGGEALIRKTIRELADELEPTRFVQIHRSVIVNLHQASHVVRGANETAEVHLRGRNDVLPVSRQQPQMAARVQAGVGLAAPWRQASRRAASSMRRVSRACPAACPAVPAPIIASPVPHQAEHETHQRLTRRRLAHREDTGRLLHLGQLPDALAADPGRRCRADRLAAAAGTSRAAHRRRRTRALWPGR